MGIQIKTYLHLQKRYDTLAIEQDTKKHNVLFSIKKILKLSLKNTVEINEIIPNKIIKNQTIKECLYQINVNSNPENVFLFAKEMYDNGWLKNNTLVLKSSKMKSLSTFSTQIQISIPCEINTNHTQKASSQQISQYVGFMKYGQHMVALVRLDNGFLSVFKPEEVLDKKNVSIQLITPEFIRVQRWVVIAGEVLPEIKRLYLHRNTVIGS